MGDQDRKRKGKMPEYEEDPVKRARLSQELHGGGDGSSSAAGSGALRNPGRGSGDSGQNAPPSAAPAVNLQLTLGPPGGLQQQAPPPRPPPGSAGNRSGGTAANSRFRFRGNQNPGQNAPPLAPVVSNQTQGQQFGTASSSGHGAVQQQQLHQQNRPMGHPHDGALGGSSSNPGAGGNQVVQARARGNMPPPQFQPIRENSAVRWVNRRPAPRYPSQAPPGFQNLHGVQRPPRPRPPPPPLPSLPLPPLQPPPPVSAGVQQLPVGQHGLLLGGSFAQFEHPVLLADHSTGGVPQFGWCGFCGRYPAQLRYTPRRHLCMCIFCRCTGRVACSMCDGYAQ